jgi:hypothetical protein
VGAVLFFPSASHAQEVINAFRSDIAVSEDGSFVVTEEIEYSFGAARHGIFREIPLTHPEEASSALRERVIEIELIDIQMDGETVPYQLESLKNLFRVRIGDPDATIDGPHTYLIAYKVSGGLSYPKNATPELYFNVTGNGWQVPIRYAVATVHAEGLMRPERACYKGVIGTGASCAILEAEDGSITFSTNELLPGEGMTIAQSLAHGGVARDVHERIKLGWFLIPFILGFLVWAAARTYGYKTEYKTDAPIIAQYEPFAGVKPMYAGLLIDRRLDAHDVTAGIVYLAREGYLKIRHLEQKVLFVFEVDDYEITLLRPITETRGSFEEELLVMLFDDSAAKVGTRISLKDLKDNHAEARENFALLQELQERMRKDLQEQGFITGFEFRKLFRPQLIIGFVVAATLITIFSSIALIFFLIGLAILFIIVANGRRTRKGYEALDHLRGFKQFLSITEKERYVFHNAPKRNADQFMEYLPYAIAFGVEKEWAKAFEGITIPDPSWYDGGSGAHAFSAVALTNSLSSFSTALASSGASASSGGGSSGGGSGGGGGGSW